MTVCPVMRCRENSWPSNWTSILEHEHSLFSHKMLCFEVGKTVIVSEAGGRARSRTKWGLWGLFTAKENHWHENRKNKKQYVSQGLFVLFMMVKLVNFPLESSQLRPQTIPNKRCCCPLDCKVFFFSSSKSFHIFHLLTINLSANS